MPNKASSISLPKIQQSLNNMMLYKSKYQILQYEVEIITIMWGRFFQQCTIICILVNNLAFVFDF